MFASVPNLLKASHFVRKNFNCKRKITRVLFRKPVSNVYSVLIFLLCSTHFSCFSCEGLYKREVTGVQKICLSFSVLPGAWSGMWVSDMDCLISSTRKNKTRWVILISRYRHTKPSISSDRLMQSLGTSWFHVQLKCLDFYRKELKMHDIL